MRYLALLAVVILAGTGCGGGSSSSSGSGAKDQDMAGMSSSTVGSGTAGGGRTVDVEMHDISYSPASIPVHAGETVTFVFHNMGRIQHEAFLGDAAAQADHDQEMAGGTGGGMAGMGGEAVKVDPGKTATITHTFKPGETLLIGCHEPGHYAAGMKVALPET